MAVEGTKIKELIYKISIQSKDLKSKLKEVEESTKALNKALEGGTKASEQLSKKFGDSLSLLAKDSKAPLDTLTKGIDNLTKASIALGRVGAGGVGTFGGVFAGVLRGFGIGGVLAASAIGIANAGTSSGSNLSVKGIGLASTPSELKALDTTFGVPIPGYRSITSQINTASRDATKSRQLFSFLGNLEGSPASLTTRFIERARRLMQLTPKNLWGTVLSAHTGVALDTETLNQISAIDPNSFSQYRERVAYNKATGVDEDAKKLELAQKEINQAMDSFSTVFIKIAAKLTPAIHDLTAGLEFILDKAELIGNIINPSPEFKFNVFNSFLPEPAAAFLAYKDISLPKQDVPKGNAVSINSKTHYDRIRRIQYGLESSFGENPNKNKNPDIIGDYQINPRTALEARGLAINATNIQIMREKLKDKKYNEETRDIIINRNLARYGGNDIWALGAYHGWGKINGETAEGAVGTATKNYLMSFFKAYPELRQQYSTEYNNLLHGNTLGTRPNKASKTLAYSPNTNLMQMPDTALASNNSTSNIMNIHTMNIQTDARNAQELQVDIAKKIQADNVASSFGQQWGMA